MKLKKILLASATVAAFSAVMSISALATEYKLTDIKYTPAEGNNPAYVTVTDAPEFADGSSYTMLILNTKNGEILTKIENPNDIKQIGEETVSYKGKKIPVALEEGATYEVRMGGNGDLYTGTFPVPKAVVDNPYYDNGTILVGDADTNGSISINDASTVASALATGTYASKDAEQAADADDNGAVSINDASTIASHLAGVDVGLGSKTLSQKNSYVGATN